MNTVLLVEDDLDAGTLARCAIERTGLRVTVRVAKNGREALQVLQAPGDAFGGRALPALILLDVKMPGMDGIETLRRLRGLPLGGWLPVVMITTFEAQETVAQAYALGAQGYVLKSSSFAAFCADIDIVLRYWLEVVRRPDDPRSHRDVLKGLRGAGEDSREIK